jgi:hypothetical protein
MKILVVYCNICKKPTDVPYEPNEFFSEEWVRMKAICNDCDFSRMGRKPTTREEPKNETPTLPYVD